MENITILPTKVKTPISPKTVEKRVVFKDLSAQRNVTPVKSETHPKENVSEKNHSTAKVEFAREFIETFPALPVSSLSSESLESTLATCSSKTQPSISSFSSYRSLSQYSSDSPGSLPDVVSAGRNRSCHDLNDTTSSADYESANEEDDSIYIQGIGDVIAGLENCQLKTPRGKLQNKSIEKFSLNTTFNISSPETTDSPVDFANDSGSTVSPTVTNETTSTIDDNSIQFANTGNTTVFAANLTQLTEDSPQLNSCLNRLDSPIDNPKSLSQLAEDVVKLGVDIVAVLETQNKAEIITTIPLNTAHIEPTSSAGQTEDVIKISQLLSCTNFTDIVDEELNVENNTAENSYLPIEFADSEVTFSGRESGAYDPLSTTGSFSEFGDDSSSSSRVEKITDSDGIITETGVYVSSVEDDLSETLVEEEYVIAAEPEICLNTGNEESAIYNCEDIDSIILNVTIEEQLYKTNLSEEKLEQELTPELTEDQVDTDKTSTGLSTLSYVPIIAEQPQLNTFIEDDFSTQQPLAYVRPDSFVLNFSAAVPSVCDIDVSPEEHSSKIDFPEPSVHVLGNLEPEQIKTDLPDSGAFSVLQVIPERIRLEPESLPGKKQDLVEQRKTELSDPEEFSVELGISERISLEPESPPGKIEEPVEQNKADPEEFSVEVGISEHISLEPESCPGKIEDPVEQNKADPEEFSVELGVSENISLEPESPGKIEDPVEQNKADPEEFSVEVGISEHISLEPESCPGKIEDPVEQNKADPEEFSVELGVSEHISLEPESPGKIEDPVEQNKAHPEEFSVEVGISERISLEPESPPGKIEDPVEPNKADPEEFSVEVGISEHISLEPESRPGKIEDPLEQNKADPEEFSVELGISERISLEPESRPGKIEDPVEQIKADPEESSVELCISEHISLEPEPDLDTTFGATKTVLEELTIEVTEAAINSAEECPNTEELCLQTVQPSVPLGVHSEAAPAGGVNLTEPVKQNKSIFGDQISFVSNSSSLTNLKKDGSTAKKQSSDFDAMLEQEAAKVSAGHLNASREIISVDEMEPAMDEMTLDPFKTTNNLSTSPPIRAQPFDYSTVRDDFKPSPKNVSQPKKDPEIDNNFNMEFSFAPPVPLPRQKRDASASHSAYKPQKPIAPQSSVLPRAPSASQCSPLKNQKPQQFPKVALPSEDTASSSHESAAPSNTAVIMPTRRCDNRNDDENLRIKSNMEAAQMQTITSPRRGDCARFTTVEQGFEVDESQFGKPAEFFDDPTAFDYLLAVGNSCPTRNLARDSLFVRFDPLVGVASLPAGLRSDLTSVPVVNTSPNSSASSHSQSPNRTSVKNMSGYEHQGDLNISVISAPRTPNATPVRNPVIDRIDRLISLSPASPVKKIPEPVPVVIDHEKMQVIEELKQLRELMSVQEEENQQKLAELRKKVDLVESKEEALIKRVADKTKSEQQMSVVMTEYEKNISQLIAEREQQRILHSQQLSEAAADRDVAMHHLSNLENSFTDVHAKYERCKQLIEEFKVQEAHLKKSNLHLQDTVKAQENRYEALKSHAMSQLEKANIDLDNIRKSNHIEVAKLNALLKKAELKLTSLQENLAQKTKENEELARICDEIIAKVSEK